MVAIIKKKYIFFFYQVKEEYLRNFLRMKVAKELQELSLNKCSITENLFDFDEGNIFISVYYICVYKI